MAAMQTAAVGKQLLLAVPQAGAAAVLRPCLTAAEAAAALAVFCYTMTDRLYD